MSEMHYMNPGRVNQAGQDLAVIVAKLRTMSLVLEAQCRMLDVTGLINVGGSKTAYYLEEIKPQIEMLQHELMNQSEEMVKAAMAWQDQSSSA